MSSVTVTYQYFANLLPAFAIIILGMIMGYAGLIAVYYLEGFIVAGLGFIVTVCGLFYLIYSMAFNAWRLG